MRRLRRIEHEVQLADDIDDTCGPNTQVAASQRTGSLPAEFADHFPTQAGVLHIQVLQADGVGRGHYLICVRSHGVRHAPTVHPAPFPAPQVTMVPDSPSRLTDTDTIRVGPAPTCTSSLPPRTAQVCITVGAAMPAPRRVIGGGKTHLASGRIAC